QCHSVFRNIKTVLEDAGSSWEHIVDVTVFLTNMKDDFAIYNKIYAEYFATNRPTRTTVEVTRLPTPIAIELKVIATMPDQPGRQNGNHVVIMLPLSPVPPPSRNFPPSGRDHFDFHVRRGDVCRLRGGADLDRLLAGGGVLVGGHL